MNSASENTSSLSKTTIWSRRIVLGLVIISFCFWGVSGYLNQRGQSQAVATVGEGRIGKDYFQQRLNQSLQQYGGKVTMGMLFKLGLVDQFLASLINQTLLDLEMQSLNLEVPRSSVERYIKMDPSFTDETGQFDPAKLKAFLENSSVNEGQLIHQVMTNVREQQLSAALVGGVVLPNAIKHRFYDKLFETRSLTIWTIDEAKIKIDQKATEDDLKGFYDKHKSIFKHPEMRAFSVLEVMPEKIDTQAAITEEALQKAYEENIHMFETPEKRDVQLLTLKEGETFDGLNPGKYGSRWIKLGMVSKDFLDEEIGQIAFAQSANTSSQPFTHEGNQKVVKIGKVQAKKLKPMGAVKKELATLVRQQAQEKEMLLLTQQIDDAIANGQTFEEIAAAFPVKLSAYPALTMQSIDESGKEHALEKGMVDVAFSQQEKEEGQFQESKDGKMFMVRVDQIQAEGVPAFAEIKGDVEKAWAHDKRMQAAKKAAYALVEGLKKDSKNLGQKKLATRMKLSHQTRMDLLQGDVLTGATVNDVFHLPEKTGLLVGQRKTGDWAVIQVTGFEHNQPNEKTETYKAFEHELKAALLEDMQRAYLESLNDTYGVEIHKDVLDQMAEGQ